jgi:hypothetical protein
MSTSDAGAKRAACRASSDPIEPPCAGDEHTPPPEKRSHILVRLGQGGSSQQVLEPDVAHARERQPSPRRQLAHRRNGLESHARGVARLHHLAHPAPGQRGDGDHGGLRLELAQHARQLGDRAVHAQALDQVSGEPRIGIDEADRLEPLLARAVPPHLLDEPHRRVVGTDHQRAHLSSAAAAEDALAVEPPGEPRAPQEHQLPHPHQRDERAR